MKREIRKRLDAARWNGGGTRNGTATPRGRAVTLCAVCNLPDAQRRRVDRELLEETASLGAIAVRVGCGKSSVKRHADRHLKPAVKAEVQRIEAGAEVAPPTPPKPGDPPDIRRGVRPVVERLYERCAEWADRAKDDSSWPMFVACVREARQSAELVARLNGELDSFQAGATTVNQYILVPPTLPLPPAPRPAVVVEIQAASENTQDEGRDLT